MRRSSLVHQKYENFYNFEMWTLRAENHIACMMRAEMEVGVGGIAFFLQTSGVKNASISRPCPLNSVMEW